MRKKQSEFIEFIMNKRFRFLFIYFLFFVLANNAFAEVNLTDLVKNIQPAVVTVITYDSDNKPLNQGSGFFINHKGHLITNYHVLEGAYQAEIKTQDGKKYPIMSIIAENKAMDLIKVSTDIPLKSVQWLNVTGALPAIAERIVVIGSPMGLEQTISEGIVSGVRKIPNKGKILQISAPISSGSSGSPVVNMKGQVVGVATFYLMKGQSLNFAIPAQLLIDLKPLITHKTLSKWTYDTGQKSLRKETHKSRLYVRTEPKGGKIRILNIKPKFYQGITLNPGRYHLEISANGYETKRMWIKIEIGEDKILKASLKNLLDLAEKKKLHTEGIEIEKRATEGDIFVLLFENLDRKYYIPHENCPKLGNSNEHEILLFMKRLFPVRPNEVYSSLGNTTYTHQGIRYDYDDYFISYSFGNEPNRWKGKLYRMLFSLKIKDRLVSEENTKTFTKLKQIYGNYTRVEMFRYPDRFVSGSSSPKWAHDLLHYIWELPNYVVQYRSPQDKDKNTTTIVVQFWDIKFYKNYPYYNY